MQVLQKWRVIENEDTWEEAMPTLDVIGSRDKSRLLFSCTFESQSE